MEFDVMKLWMRIKSTWQNKKIEFDPSKGEGLTSFSARKGGNYCGPGWGFTREDVIDGTVTSLPHPIDSIDGACMAHDQCYGDNGYFSGACDAALLKQLDDVLASPESTDSDKLDAAIMTGVFTVLYYSVDKLAGVLRDAEALYEEIKFEFERNTRMENIVNMYLAR